MKPAEVKREYIRLRAEGQSYDSICERIHISKSTCAKWERELSRQISDIKNAELAELCESYGMAKESRIRRLGTILKKIEDAIERADFTKVDPVRLLEYNLRYTEALKGEYISAAPTLEGDSVDAKGILIAFTDLLNRSRSGDITADQAQKEGAILSQLLKAYDAADVKTKLDELEAIIGGRP